MWKLHKKYIAIVIVVIIALTCFYQKGKETYASNTDNYLVLIQQKNGSWKAYHNLVVKSGNGNLMVKAKSLSKALGFTYKNKSNGTFLIKRNSERYNTYTKNTNQFTYTDGSDISTLKTSSATYLSKISKYNLCQADTLNTLLNYKYFSSDGNKGYADFEGVLCFSKYQKLPVVVPVTDLEPTKKPTPTPRPEPAVISIEGIEFPVRDSFLSVKNSLSDWGQTAPLWSALELEVDSKIIDTTDLVFASNKIEFTHMGAGSDGVLLVKASEGYKISISVKLAGSVMADQNAAVLKAMIVTISSKPTLVYTAIFESFTSGITHGINEDKYITIGDCLVKAKLEDGSVIYYIKKA
jgi:hypothetical protein